jgi:predicted amino acid racemase
MIYPRLTIDLNRIRENLRRLRELCGASIEVMGVTKGVCGDVEVARAFVAGGVSSLGDARLPNLDRLRRAGLGVPLWLLRAPGPSEVASTVGVCDGSLNADARVVALLGDEAVRQRKRHRILLMIDLDTGREGFPPEKTGTLVEAVQSHAGLELAGIGTYFDFRSDPSFVQEKLGELVRIATGLGLEGRYLSGGASNVLDAAILKGRLPRAINHLRIGTAPLLGISTSHGPKVLEGWDRDAFLLEAEIIEVKRGRRQALLSLGHLDAPYEYLYPKAAGVVLLDASSDHTLVDFSSAPRELATGDVLVFRLGYCAMNRLMLSPYTRVVYR